MVLYTSPVFWFFILLTGLGLIVLRQKDPNRERPFRVPLYPFTDPVLSDVRLSALFQPGVCCEQGRQHFRLIGIAVLLLGVPLMFLVKGRRAA